jgi:hypothetical protein
VIARHISKHIPGRPTTIVENMPGAGNLIAGNYIYNRAKPDGLTIGNWTWRLVLQEIMGRKAIEFDSGRFEWVGAWVFQFETRAAHETQQDLAAGKVSPHLSCNF